MTIFTHDSTMPLHPYWCAREVFCSTTHPHDARHSTVPRLLQAAEDDVEVTVARQRDDEYDPNVGAWAAHSDGVLLHLCNTASVDSAGNPVQAGVFLTAGDAEQLAVVLMEHAMQVRDDAAGGTS